MKTRIFENPVKFAQSVKVKVDGEYVSLLELLQNADIELDETPTSGSDKAVSSGGVFNALEVKQNQISITENDDGSVDITIPDAGEVSSGGVTVIDVSTITETNEDGFYVLDLSTNGTYIVNNNSDDNVQINFGFCKNVPDYGKLITQAYSDAFYSASGGFEGSSSKIIVLNNKVVLFIVNDDYIQFYSSSEF